jgi:hypothetical protein
MQTLASPLHKKIHRRSKNLGDTSEFPQRFVVRVGLSTPAENNARSVPADRSACCRSSATFTRRSTPAFHMQEGHRWRHPATYIINGESPAHVVS